MLHLTKKVQDAVNCQRSNVNCYNQSGLATLEMLIAMVVIVLAITAVLPLITSGQNSTIGSQTTQGALYKAQELLESVRTAARANFSTVAGLACSDATGTCVTPIDPFYNRTVTISPDPSDPTNDYKKLVTSQVVWGTGLETSLSTIITDWKSALNSCSQTITGDWSNPIAINTAKINIDAGNSVTDITTTNGYTYIAANGAAAAKDDFYIVNTSDPINPVLVSGGSIDTGPGLNAVAVNGNYAYVANSSINAQLQVINMTTKGNLTYKSFKLPTTDSDTGTVGYSIYYNNGKVYLGTQKSGKAGFHIIDVSNLNSINEVGYIEVNNTINRIYVSNAYAYLASADSTQEMAILDISTPSNIIPKSIYNAPNSANFGYGNSVAISGTVLYLGRTFDSSGSNNELYTLDASSPASNPLPVLNSQKIGDSVNGMAVKGTLLFIATNSQFQVRKTSDLSLYGSMPLNSNSPNIDCLGNYVYAGVTGPTGNSNKDVLQIIGPSLLSQSTLTLMGLPSSAPYQQSGITAGTSGGSGTGAVTFDAGSSTACSVNSLTGAVTITSGTGTCSIIATKAADSTYKSATSVAVSIAVSKINQSVLTAVATPGTVTFGNTSALSTTGGNGTGAITYTAGGSGGCSVSGSTLSVVNASLTCTVTATKAADSNYNSVTSSAITVTLQKANQATLTAVATPGAVTYGNTSALSVSGGSGTGGVTYTAGGTGGCSISGSTLSVVNASLTCTVTATKATDGNYNATNSSALSITLNKATPTLSLTNSPVIYNGSPQSAIVTGSVVGTASNKKYNGSIAVPTNAGTYAVTANFTPNDTANYNSLTNASAGNFTISKASPTISTTIIPSSSVASGTVVSDKANVSSPFGVPTGTVDFILYKNGSCATTPGNQVLQSDLGRTLSSGVAQSLPHTTKNGEKPSASYLATYNGDANYNSVAASCELLTIN